MFELSYIDDLSKRFFYCNTKRNKGAKIRLNLRKSFGVYNQLKANKYYGGFTMIETIIVISIIVIMVSIIVPNYYFYIERVKRQVCNKNCLQLERMYNLFLITEKVNQLDVDFSKYRRDYYEENICPNQGEISYVNEKVYCSIHSPRENVDNNKEQDESVPYL